MADPADALRPLLAHLAEYLAARPALRAEVAAAARAVAEWAEATRPAEPAPSSPSPPTPEVPLSPTTTPAIERPAVVPIPADFRIPIRMATEGAPAAYSFAAPPSRAPEVLLSAVAARCRLKGEAARHLAERGPGARDGRAEFFARASGMSDCYLWLFDGMEPPPAAWGRLADAFGATAAAADLLAAWLALPPEGQDAPASEVLHAAAHAQAVLYAAAADAGKERPDYDQLALFQLVRDEARERSVFVSRHLSRDHPADPAAGPLVSARLGELAQRLRRPADPAKLSAKRLSNLKFKLGRLAADPVGQAGEWPRVVELIDELVTACGVPPSNVELRELLLPHADRIPDEILTPPAARVLREIDLHRERLAELAAAAGGGDDSDSLSPAVAEVRAYLGGRDAVFIGGEMRPNPKAALERAFGLGELNWITTLDHTPTGQFEAPVARPEVAIVLLATRWSSHDYQNVRGFCVKHGKLFVKLPAGYHPNRVAHEILGQVGHKLRELGGG